MHAAGAGVEQAVVVDLEDALGIDDFGRDLEAVSPVRKQGVAVGGDQLPGRLSRVGPVLAGQVHFRKHRPGGPARDAADVTPRVGCWQTCCSLLQVAQNQGVHVCRRRA